MTPLHTPWRQAGRNRGQLGTTSFSTWAEFCSAGHPRQTRSPRAAAWRGFRGPHHPVRSRSPSKELPIPCRKETCMADTPKRAKTGKPKQPASPARTRLIVKRGAVHRHAALKQKTADLAVDVLWDRREADRRAAADKVEDDRRKADRRKKTTVYVGRCRFRRGGRTGPPEGRRH